MGVDTSGEREIVLHVRSRRVTRQNRDPRFFEIDTGIDQILH